jgi:hypothetical protein
LCQLLIDKEILFKNAIEYKEHSKENIYGMYCTESGSLDEGVETDGTFYITKDATYRWNLLPPFLFNDPGTVFTPKRTVSQDVG